MINKKNILILVLCLMLLMGLSKTAKSEVEIAPRDIDATLRYDDNVTRERLKGDYQYGIVWLLDTGFGIKNFIPVNGLDTRANYKLGMRDVSTTNDEDYSSHIISLSSKVDLKTGTNISLRDVFELRNSQNDLFNFYNNQATMDILQPFGEKTTAILSYSNGKKVFQNNAPEVQARNFLDHRMGTDVLHRISDDFTVQLGYVHQYSIYNRAPIDFRKGRPIALEGVQRDHRNVIKLGCRVALFNYTTLLELRTQVLNSTSNSRFFNFNGNKTRIILGIIPIQKLRISFDYQIVGFDLGVQQTPDIGYELSEIRTDDQSHVKLGASYSISPQVSLEFDYKHTENTALFPGESYNKNTFSTGLRIKF